MTAATANMTIARNPGAAPAAAWDGGVRVATPRAVRRLVFGQYGAASAQTKACFQSQAASMASPATMRTLLSTSPRPRTSPQVLRELYVVATSKLGLSLTDATAAVRALVPSVSAVEDATLIVSAVIAAQRWQVSLWDALIIEGLAAPARGHFFPRIFSMAWTSTGYSLKTSSSASDCNRLQIMGCTKEENGDQRLLALWRAEQSHPMSGWDFTQLRGRMEEDEPPWDFDAECRKALTRADHVLDMGTGGGEQLLTFADVLPSDTVATEGWPPNVPVARAALARHHIPVVVYDAESADAAGRELPFPAGRFDLVLNRHEAFVAAEVARVLSAGGVFVTQQVGGDDADELHDLFGSEAGYPADLNEQLLAQVRSAGMRVDEAGDWSGRYRFHDVAALVAYLQLVPWDAPPDFTVDRYADQLLALQRDHRDDPIAVTKRRFWFRAARR